MKKLLPILVIVMLFVAGGTSYYAYSVYTGGNDKDIETVKVDNEEIENIEDSKKNNNEVEASPVSNVAEDKVVNTSLTMVLNNLYKYDPEVDDFVYAYTINFPMTFINHTDKDIKGFIGVLIYKDMFGDVLKELDLRYEYDVIPAKGSIEWLGSYEVNRFDDMEMRFFHVPFENVIFNYEVNSIHFTDGTSIEL